MPTYQYVCKNCGHTLEELQSFNEPPLITCPACGKDALARVMGQGSGLIFKGSGFYKTDYVKGADKKPTTEPKKEEKKTKEETAPPTSTDTKPSTPPPSPPESKKE